MATNYPSSLDTFDTIAADKKTSESVGGRTHRDMHNDVADALEAVQAELGTDPAGTFATVKARFDSLTGGLGNLLTENQASGTDTLSATTGFNNAYQCTESSSTDRAWQGSRSLKLTTSGSTPAIYTPLTTSGVPVVPGQVYTADARAWLTGTGAATVSLRFYTSGGSNLGDTAGSKTSGAAWGRISATATAPATAAFATVYVSGAGITSGDIIYVDGLGLWAGAGGEFAMPGKPIVNTGRRVTSPLADDRLVQVWDAGNSRWQRISYDSGVHTSAHTLGSGWSVAAAVDYLSRHDDTVSIELILTKAGLVSSGDTAFTIPAGFRPAVALYNVVCGTNSGTAVKSINIATNGVVTTAGAFTDPYLYMNLRYRTTTTIPSSLPGSLVSAAPYA